MKKLSGMKIASLLVPLAMLPALASAQAGFRLPGAGDDEDDSGIPLLTPAERKTVEDQREEFSNAFSPALGTAAKSTVRIWYKARRGGDRKASYGTVIGDGTKILTKWSQVADAVDDFRVEDSSREVRAVKVTGVYPDEDLAVLTIEGAPLTPVKFTPKSLGLGGFLVASQPDGRPAGYGVVSVLERNLRKTDQGFLGVTVKPGYSGPGVLIEGVEDGSGAGAAGLKPGDSILKIGDREISSLTELQNSLWGAKPGTEIDLQVIQNKVPRMVKVILGNRPPLKQFSGDRLGQMERMGSRLSRVREGFTHAVETDMVLEPEQIGGPVANLQGEVVGISLSRAGRTRSYIMPAAAVEELLKSDTTDPSLAAAAEPEQPMVRAREAGQPQMAPMDPDDVEKMKRHMGDMTKLMERIQGELDALEKGE